MRLPTAWKLSPPDGSRLTYDAPYTRYSLYLVILPQGGDYTWHATALDGTGNTLCAAQPARFSKPQPQPTKKPRRESEPRQGSASGAGGGPGVGGAGGSGGDG